MLLDLNDERAEDPGLAGAKASWLARGLRAGLPVLPGFVVPTSFSRQPMQQGREIMQTRGSGGARLAISQAGMPNELAAAVIAASEELGDRLVVRSSSVLEGGGEWSGAFTSYLDLRPEETPVGVRGCWASTYTVHTLERHEAAGIEPGTAPMAVLIQPEVTPEFGGVAKLAEDEVAVTGVVGSPVPLVQGWDPGVHAQVAANGVIKGAAAISSLGEDTISNVAESLRQAERTIGANSCEWAIVEGEVVLLQLSRAEVRERMALMVSDAFGRADIAAIGRLVRRYPGPLGEELVLPWAVAAPDAFLVDAEPADLDPIEAFAEAREQARTLTAEVWGGPKPEAVERASSTIRGLRGDEPIRAADTIAALRPPDAARARAVLSMLARVRVAMVAAGAVSAAEQGWHMSTSEITEALRLGRAKELRSRIGFDRWEPFDVAVVVSHGEFRDALSAAPGIGVGRMCFVDDGTAALEFRPRDVVVGLRPTPQLAPLLWDASAVITTGGGPAAHLFESARALAIPALASVDLEGLLGQGLVEASGRFAVAVDGNAGRLWVTAW